MCGSRVKVAFVFRRLGFLCALLAAFSLAGGHWTALQTVARATMLYRYAQRSGSLAVAAAETFDGQHPAPRRAPRSAARGPTADAAAPTRGLRSLICLSSLTRDASCRRLCRRLYSIRAS